MAQPLILTMEETIMGAYRSEWEPAVEAILHKRITVRDVVKIEQELRTPELNPAIVTSSGMGTERTIEFQRIREILDRPNNSAVLPSAVAYYDTHIQPQIRTFRQYMRLVESLYLKYALSHDSAALDSSYLLTASGQSAHSNQMLHQYAKQTLGLLGSLAGMKDFRMGSGTTLSSRLPYIRIHAQLLTTLRTILDAAFSCQLETSSTSANGYEGSIANMQLHAAILPFGAHARTVASHSAA